MIAALVLVLGSIGFARSDPSEKAIDSFYRSVQLFGFGGNVSNSPNTWLEVARILAPLVVGYAAVGVVLGLYRDQVRAMRIRGLRNHVVMVGLGDAGLTMASAFDQEGWRVIAVEKNASNTAIHSARELGIWVVLGDATDANILRRAGVARADLLVVMCGDDGINIDVATAARRLCHVRKRGILTTIIELDDFELWQIMKAQALVDRDHAAFRLELLNVRGLAAEMLINAHPAFVPQDSADPHVLLVGTEHVGMSVAVEILKRWQALRRGSGTRLRLTLAGLGAEAAITQMLAEYPEIASMRGVQLGAWPVDAAKLSEDAAVPDAISTIYVFLESEARALAAALALRQHPRLWEAVPIVVAVADENAGVGAAIRRGGRTLDKVTAFGVLSRTLQPEATSHTATEVIARLGHEYYRQQQVDRGKTERTDPALKPWEMLPRDLRESNRLWADGIAAHLSDLRLVVAPAPLMDLDEPVFEFDPEDVERLARREHERWEAAMKRLGYRHGPVRTARTHPMIDVPYDELPEENKDKDRAHVRAIPGILAQAGFRISRLGADPDAGAERLPPAELTATASEPGRY